MILRCGMTGSGRKATCRNGSASVHAERLGGAAQRDQRLAHLLEGSRGSSGPATGSASSASTSPSSTTTKPPLISRKRLTARRHVLVVDADDADVVAVVPDRRGDRAALHAEALDEAVGRCCR